MIGRDDIGQRQQPVAHQWRDVGVDEQAAVAIPQHGVAGIAQTSVAGAGAGDKVRDDAGDFGRAEIARQDHVSGTNGAALLDPKQQIANQLRVQHPAADGFVTRPVAEQCRGYRDDVDAVHLHRKHRGGVADMAVSDLRLNRNDGHCSDCSPDEAQRNPGRL